MALTSDSELIVVLFFENEGIIIRSVLIIILSEFNKIFKNF